jgi:hypothetical protein
MSKLAKAAHGLSGEGEYDREISDIRLINRLTGTGRRRNGSVYNMSAQFVKSF